MTDIHTGEQTPTPKRTPSNGVPSALPPAIAPLDYDAAVAEAKQLMARREKDHWRLCS